MLVGVVLILHRKKTPRGCLVSMVGVLAKYSKQAHRKTDRLSTAARALRRLKSEETRSRVVQGERHSRRYRTADRFSSEDLAAIGQRYQTGERQLTSPRSTKLPSQSFHLSHNQAGLLSTARFKKICRQISFEKYIDKRFSITNNIFIKSAGGRFTDKSSMYYFLLPSMLVSELQSRYKLMMYKIKERDSK